MSATVNLRMDRPGMDILQPEPLPYRHALGLRLRQELRICSVALHRIGQAKARQRKTKAMTDSRDWQTAVTGNRPGAREPSY